MNINRTGLQGMYKSGAISPVQSEASAPPRAEGSKHTDTISISRTGALSKELGKASRDIAAEVERADTTQVQSIRDAVRGNTYHVPAEQVADAILARALGV